MILGFKTKNKKEIEKLEKEIEQLKNELMENNKIIAEMIKTNKKDYLTIKTLTDQLKFYKQGYEEQLKEIENNTQVQNELESRRKKVVAKCGGLTKEINKLKFENEDLKKLLKKRKLDYCFALRVLFREIKMTQDTRIYLKQRLIDLEKEGCDKNVSDISK